MAASDHDPGQPGSGPAPSLEALVGQFGTAGRAGLEAGVGALRAFRRLLVADLALARVALVRALVWLTVAVAFGASAWLLVMAAGIALLHHLGMSWLASISVMALISVIAAAFAAWQALRYFAMSRLEATRRQLARLGIGGDDDEEETAATAKASEEGSA